MMPLATSPTSVEVNGEPGPIHWECPLPSIPCEACCDVLPGNEKKSELVVRTSNTTFKRTGLEPKWHRTSEICILWLTKPRPCQLGSRYLAQVSLYSLNAHTHTSARASPYSGMDCHLFATLEILLLSSGPCLAQVASCHLRQNSGSILHTKHADVGFASASSSSILLFLSSLRHDALLSVRRKMAARKHRKVHDVEQTKKIVPHITCEITLSQKVHKLVFGVHMFGLDFGVQRHPIKQPIQRNSVGSGHVSHSRTSAFDDHFDHRFIVFKNTTALHLEKSVRL